MTTQQSPRTDTMTAGPPLPTDLSAAAGEPRRRSGIDGRSDTGLRDQLRESVVIVAGTAVERGRVDRQFLRDVAAALRCLDDLDRQSLELTYFGGMSIVDVAARTEVSTAEVARRMSRGLLRFQESFTQCPPDL